MTEKQNKSVDLYRKPNSFAYGFISFACRICQAFVFHRTVVRNELKDTKEAFVLLCNHECALDCVNAVGLTKRKLTFVLSFAFFHTLPIRGMLEKAGVIVKQQFHTKINDLKKMKAVIDRGQGLVIYPAGLMSENGRSTPIPEGTWSLLKWLSADVYMARTVGAYFVMPKWAKGLRPGKTEMDVYRLFTKEELQTLSDEEIHRRAEEALLFDAYAEQESRHYSYKGGAKVEGLEKVLYRCPECGEKYTISASGNTLTCTSCGFRRTATDTGLFTEGGEYGDVAKWSAAISKMLENELTEKDEYQSDCRIEVIDFKKKKFRPAGKGHLTLNAQTLTLQGTVDGEEVSLCQSLYQLPCLPFSPGKRLEIQTATQTYRCYLADGHKVMEWIDALRIWHRRAIKE